MWMDATSCSTWRRLPIVPHRFGLRQQAIAKVYTKIVGPRVELPERPHISLECAYATRFRFPYPCLVCHRAFLLRRSIASPLPV